LIRPIQRNSFWSHSSRLQASIPVDDSVSPEVTKKAQGNASFLSSYVNLLKNCVGSAVFSIHSRVVHPTGHLHLFPVSVLVGALSSWAAYNFYLIAETCQLTNTSTYPEAWSKAVSPNTRWLVQSVVVIAPIVGCLANVIVLTDIFKLLLQSLGTPSNLYGNRNLLITLLTAFILFPINIFKDLSGLRSVSALGLTGHLSAMIALLIRIKDAAYFPGGQYYTAQAVASIPSVASSIPPIAQWTTLASMLSYCFVAHYNVRLNTSLILV
jgi:hypothetical protein